MIDMEAESERYQLMEDENLNRIVKRSAATKISNHVVGKYAKYEEVCGKVDDNTVLPISTPTNSENLQNFSPKVLIF